MRKRKKSSVQKPDRYLDLVDRVIRLAEKVMDDARKERHDLIATMVGVGAKPPEADRVPSDEESWAAEQRKKGLDPIEIAKQIDSDTHWDDRVDLKAIEEVNGNGHKDDEKSSE